MVIAQWISVCPYGPAKLVIPFALSVLAVRLILQLWGYARAFKENAQDPIAVPLIEDAATQAANEAATVSVDDKETQ